VISHETHRGRCLYHPMITLHLIRQFPELKLTLDMSHWAVVTERLTEGGWFNAAAGSDEEEQCWNEVVSRVEHIHARIGSAQHAQTGTEATPQEREIFQGVWCKVWRTKLNQHNTLQDTKEAREGWFSSTPEYGPPPYLIKGASSNHREELWTLVETEKQHLLNEWEKLIQS